MVMHINMHECKWEILFDGELNAYIYERKLKMFISNIIYYYIGVRKCVAFTFHRLARIT